MDEQQIRSRKLSDALLVDSILNEVDRQHPSNVSGVGSAAPTLPDILAALATRPLEVIDLSELGESGSARLTELGLSERLLLEAAKDSPIREQELLVKYNVGFRAEARAFNESEKALFNKSHVRDASYASTIFRTGGMLIDDPFTGRAIRSSNSFLIDDYHIAFRFESVECFYVMVGQTYGHRIAFIVPRSRLVIAFPQLQSSPALKAWILKCCERLVALLVLHRKKSRKEISSETQGAGVQIGFRPNLGHFVWQELQGISDIIQNHGVGSIRHLVLGPYRPFDAREVFPELAATPVTEVGDAREPFEDTIGLGVQLVRPIGLRIGTDLQQRIGLVARRRVSQEVVRNIEEHTADKFCVWINLRQHNKAWKQQVTGTAHVLNRLNQRIPNLSVIVDGFSDTTSIALEIAANLVPDIQVINTIGCSLDESLIWARHVHVYSSVVGSGLIINSWLSRKPGVAHANRAHLRQSGFWPLVAEGTISPVFLSSAVVEDDGTMYGSYDFEPEVLYDAIWKLICEYYPERVRNVTALDLGNPSPLPPTN